MNRISFYFILIISMLQALSTVSVANQFDSITYRMKNISCRWLNVNGEVVHQYEKDEIIDYRLNNLNSKKPSLSKYVNGEIIEKVQLIRLNVTKQGNIYLAEVARVGNISLLSVFPKQRLIIKTSKYYMSSQNIFILTQGYAKFEKAN